MRKLYSSWAVAMLAVIVTLLSVMPARSQQAFIPYPTLSLRNWHCQPDGIQRVPGPNGGDRYFLVPVYCWNTVDTSFNGNNNNNVLAGGQHLEPIRSFKFQFWYLTQAMQLDMDHGSPIVMTGPDTGTKALAKTFYCTFSDQTANDPNNPYRHVVRIAGASSVPLPLSNTSDSGCAEPITNSGVLLWLRFKVVVSNVQGGVIFLDSALFNEHYGDSLINASGGPSLDYHHGNLGGGDGLFGASDKGRGDIEITAQPVFLLKPLSQVTEGYTNEPWYDSLTADLVYDPTLSGGQVTRELDLSDAAGNTEIDNVTITSNQPWLSVNKNAPGGGQKIFLPGDAIDYTTGVSSTIVPVFLTVGNPQALSPGVYYATVTFTSYGAANSPLTLIVRFVRLASPDEPTAGAGTGIRLNISNNCYPVCTNTIAFGTGTAASDGLDELYGEQIVTTETIQGADTNVNTSQRCYAYFRPLNLNVDPKFLASDFLGLTRDIRSNKADTTLIYAVDFSPGDPNCYPVKVCVNPADFPVGGRIVMKYTLNGSDQGIDLRNATVDVNGMNCVTINDHRITEFYIFYTPPTIANISTFLKQFSWTLISLPVNPPNLDAGFLFPNSVSPPYLYSSQSGWNQPPGNKLEFGRGYMIRYGQYLGNDGIVSGSKQYSINNVKISEGWNSVGATSGTSIINDQVNNIVFAPNPGATNVPSLQSLDFVWEYTPQTGYDATNFMTPGRGYFIKTDYSGFYNLTGSATVDPQSQVPSGKAAERGNLMGQLGHVLVSDADQNAQTLYFGRASTTLPESRFEMPGQFQAFDARFDANSGMLSYNHSSYVVNLHASSFPLTMTFTNLAGPVEVTDMKGNVIATNVSNNGIVTISDRSVTQVRIAEKDGNSVGSNMVGYNLAPNTPNPFSRTSEISYSLPQESVVSLVVYDELGNVIQTLVSAVVPAGEHKALFDGTTLPSGTYYYTLKAGNFVQTQRMTLSK